MAIPPDVTRDISSTQKAGQPQPHKQSTQDKLGVLAEKVAQAGGGHQPSRVKPEVIKVDISRLSPTSTTEQGKLLFPEKAITGVKATETAIRALVEGFEGGGFSKISLLQTCLQIPCQELQNLKKLNPDLHTKMVHATLTMIHASDKKDLMSVFDNDEILVQIMTQLSPEIILAQDLPDTLLCKAASDWLEASQRDKLIRILVSLGADVNQPGGTGRTPLEVAIESKHPETVKLLVSLGADVNIPDKKGEILLRKTLFYGDVGMIKLLIDLGAQVRVEDINKPNASGDSPLNFALTASFFSGKERIDRVKLLASLGADCNQVDAEGGTPLEAAASFPPLLKKPIAQCLIDHGADLVGDQAFQALKLVAHNWTLEGKGMCYSEKTQKVRTIPLGGWSAGASLRNLRQLFQDFLNAQMNQMGPKYKIMGKAVLEIIDRSIDCLQFAELPEELVQLSEHEPVLLAGGTFKHTYGIVLHRNNIYYCDRAVEEPGIKEIEIDRGLEKELRSFLQIVRRASFDLVDTCFSALKVRVIRTIHQKNQKVGNCSWANLKSALLVLFLILTEGWWADKNEQLGKCLSLYKAFTKFAREQTLLAYLRDPKPDPSVLHQIEGKLQQEDSPFSQEERAKLFEKIEAKLLSSS